MNENARTNMEKQGSERRGQTRAEGGAFSSELWKVVFSVVLDFSFVTEADEMMAAPILAPAFTPAQQRRRHAVIQKDCAIACKCELTFSNGFGFRVRCRVAEASRHVRHAIEYATHCLSSRCFAAAWVA